MDFYKWGGWILSAIIVAVYISEDEKPGITIEISPHSATLAPEFNYGHWKFDKVGQWRYQFSNDDSFGWRVRYKVTSIVSSKPVVRKGDRFSLEFSCSRGKLVRASALRGKLDVSAWGHYDTLDLDKHFVVGFRNNDDDSVDIEEFELEFLVHDYATLNELQSFRNRLVP